MNTNKPGLILLHGYPLDQRLWAAQVDVLKEEYVVLTPNFPGFGGSERGTLYNGTSVSQLLDLPISQAKWETMADLADYVASLIRSKEVASVTSVDKWIVVGLSMGGYVALEFWKRHPELAAALVFTNTKATADDEQAIATRNAAIETAKAKGNDSVTNPMIPKLVTETTIQTKPVLIKSVKAMMADVSTDALVRALRAMIHRSDFSGLTEKISLPTLVLAGDSDLITPASVMKTMASGIPQSEFKVIENAGHLAPMENPTAWNNAILSFAARL